MISVCEWGRFFNAISQHISIMPFRYCATLKKFMLLGILVIASSYASAASLRNEMKHEIFDTRDAIRKDPSLLNATIAKLEGLIASSSEGGEQSSLFVYAASELANIVGTPTASPAIIRFARRGLMNNLGVEDSVVAHTLIGSATDSLLPDASNADATEFRPVATEYLEALKIILDKTKTLDKQKMQEGVLVTDASKKPDETSIKEQEKVNQENEKASLHNRLVLRGDDLINELTRIYSDSEASKEALRQIAKPILKNDDYMQILFDHLHGRARRKAGNT